MLQMFNLLLMTLRVTLRWAPVFMAGFAAMTWLMQAVPTPVSVADGTSILNAITGIQPIIEDSLTAIVAKKAAFQALPVGGIPDLVKQDLANLSSSTTALENALIASAPVSPPHYGKLQTPVLIDVALRSRS